MKNVYKCDSCSLRVRVTNRAAISLYSGVLGYKIQKIEQEYYADNENAFDMILNFNSDETKEEI
jgi:peptide alpha-N-acetyltransferase